MTENKVILAKVQVVERVGPPLIDPQILAAVEAKLFVKSGLKLTEEDFELYKQTRIINPTEDNLRHFEHLKKHLVGTELNQTTVDYISKGYINLQQYKLDRIFDEF